MLSFQQAIQREEVSAETVVRRLGDWENNGRLIEDYDVEYCPGVLRKITEDFVVQFLDDIDSAKTISEACNPPNYEFGSVREFFPDILIMAIRVACVELQNMKDVTAFTDMKNEWIQKIDEWSGMYHSRFCSQNTIDRMNYYWNQTHVTDNLHRLKNADFGKSLGIYYVNQGWFRLTNMRSEFGSFQNTCHWTFKTMDALIAIEYEVWRASPRNVPHNVHNRANLIEFSQVYECNKRYCNNYQSIFLQHIDTCYKENMAAGMY